MLVIGGLRITIQWIKCCPRAGIRHERLPMLLINLLACCAARGAAAAAAGGARELPTGRRLQAPGAVSYTHLTLPTKA